MFRTAPNRLFRREAIACLGLLMAVSACSTTAPLAPGDKQSSDDDAIADLIRSIPEEQLVAGPSADKFIGRPVAALEQITGTPALVRREGNNEFRRYDLGDCRAYAIVMPAGGTVVRLTTGPAVRGGDPIAFEYCKADTPGV